MKYRITISHTLTRKAESNMPKLAKPNEVLYHIGLSRNMIEGAEYVILPGDPHRSASLAKAFDPKAKFLADSREHVSYLANFHGQKILICSSGLGAPNIGISVEELAMIGVKYFLRVGTCGAIQPHIQLGDIVISTGAVRLEGMSRDFAPIEYPAIPCFQFTNDLITAAAAAKIPHHTGITATTDTFWQGQERYDSFTGYNLRRLRNSMDEWQKLNVANFEMEAAALFVMCSVFGLHAACICGVVAQRTQSEKVSTSAKNSIAKCHWESAAVHGILQSLKRRKLIK
jgi:uridine phosphorylase